MFKKDMILRLAVFLVSHCLVMQSGYSQSFNCPDYICEDTELFQYFHCLMQNHDVWDMGILGQPQNTLSDRQIVIALIDSDIYVCHPDLEDSFLRDGDDQIVGANFVTGGSLGPNGNTHATGVASAAAGAISTMYGGPHGNAYRGVAPLAKIMPVVWLDGTTPATKPDFADAIRFAVDNGADIITFTNPFFSSAPNLWRLEVDVESDEIRQALEYAYEDGVLLLIAVGNAGQFFNENMDWGLTVAATDCNDIKADVSQSSRDVDVSAPGENIFVAGAYDCENTKPPALPYLSVDGTSEATPMVAGAAALLWSKYPNWSRDQIAAQLVATTDPVFLEVGGDTIDPKMGSGRVNSFRAVTETLPAPQVADVILLPSHFGFTNQMIVFFTLSFNQVMDPISINNATLDGPSSISLLYFGEDGNASPVEVSLGYNSSLNQAPYRYYRVGSNDLSLVLESPLTWGRYQLIVDSTAVNPFGSELDGNGDGVGGDDYVHEFWISNGQFQNPADNYFSFRGTQVSPSSYAPSVVQESDNEHLVMQPGFVVSNVEAPVWVEFYGKLDFVPDGLEFQIESFAGTPGLTATVEMWNWNTEQWEFTGSFGEAFNNPNSTNAFGLTSKIADYVNAEAEVQARVGWRRTGFTINHPWNVNIDQVLWKGL